MKILFLEAYDAASHTYWRESLISQFNDFEWTELVLPGRYFNWRVRGNPLSWLNEPALEDDYDLILATSMVDLATLKGLYPNLANIRSIVYFHENQFAYPGSKSNHNLEAKMVSIYSALAADQLIFNSKYNFETFINGTDELIKSFPDKKPKDINKVLCDKSKFIPVGIDDNLFKEKPKGNILLWNHRWEYDKGPNRLYETIKLISELDLDFKLAICGQQFRKIPDEFKLIESQYSDMLIQFGHISDRGDYLNLLSRSKYVLSTSIHDFQGLSILEAVACGAIPILPDRLAYPNYFDQKFLYDSSEQNIKLEARSLVNKLQELDSAQIKSFPDISYLKWSELKKAYESEIKKAQQRHWA